MSFIQALIERSAAVNGVSIAEMRAGVKIMATGGGAHKFYELFKETLGVEVVREDEMECLIEGLKFMTVIPNEAYFFSDELVQQVSRPTHGQQQELIQSVNSSLAAPSDSAAFERPSPNPPQFSVTFEVNPAPQLPCLLVNIGSGVSLIKVDEDGKFERVSGTSIGGGTLWGLLSLLTPARTFDGDSSFLTYPKLRAEASFPEMLSLSEKGDNATVDMLVGDIYGQDYSRLGLKSTMIASSFGKVFRKGSAGEQKPTFTPEDISKSLLYAVSNNIGQIAYVLTLSFVLKPL